MKTETTYMKTLGKVEAKLSRMKEQAAASAGFTKTETFRKAITGHFGWRNCPSRQSFSPVSFRPTPEQSGQQLKRMRSYPIRFLLKLDLRPRDGFPFVFRHCCRRKHPAQRTISGLIFIRLCGSSLRVSLRSAFGIACLPTVMCTIEAARNGPCVITIISKPIWSRIFWRCMFCPTITRQFARITIAALPEARTARKSM